MAAIKFTGFQGIVPRTAERLLGDMFAVTAENVNVTSGELRPIKYPSDVFPAGGALTAYRAVDLIGEKWKTWTVDVDVAKGPLPIDAEGRYYWTGDGEPRFSTYALLNTTAYALGIPNPTTAVSVSHSGGSGTATTRFYRYTFVSALGEESGPSPVSAEVTGKIDGTWNIGGTTAMQAFPANTGTGTATGQIFTSAAAHWLRVGDQVVISASTRNVTAISGLTFTVDGAAITGATSWARKAYWNTTSMYRRLYRTSGTGGQYQLVADNISGTTYSDTLLDSAIEGDDLISDGWEPPPAGLRGIGVLPSGAGYGFVNNLLCFSEPYQLHTWPVSYQLATDFPIVGTKSFGTVVVVGTSSRPYLADGVEPASATLQAVDVVWPCLSKKSMCSIGDGVVFTTSAGLAMIGMGPASLFTKSFYTEAEWRELNPPSMSCALSQNRLFVRHKPIEGASSILVFTLGEQVPLTTSSVQADSIFTDETDGELYVINSSYGVRLFDGAVGARLPYTWKSKTIELPTPTNFGAVKVDFDSVMSQADYDGAIAAAATDAAADTVTFAAYTNFGAVSRGGVNFNRVNGGPVIGANSMADIDTVTFTLFADGVPKFSKQLFSSGAFRLPAGYLASNIAVAVAANMKIRSIKLAETMDGLRAI